MADLPDSLAQTRIRWQRFGFRISFGFRIASFGFGPKGCSKPGCARWLECRSRFRSERGWVVPAIRRSPGGLEVTNIGRLFIRNTALRFDNQLPPPREPGQSRTI